MTERTDLEKAASKLARAIKPPEDYQRARRVEAGLDNTGRPILSGRDFIPLQSPDGTVWRIRVTDAGLMTITEAPS